MKVVEIKDNVVYKVYEEYQTIQEARSRFSSKIQFEEAPDDVFESCIFHPDKTGSERFSRPPIEPGWEWDESGPFPYDPVEKQSIERKRLHEATTNDTMQALRKLREGDKTIDWQAWLDALDAYNVAIEKTKEQEGYPLKVTYPEYPTKPTS